MIKLHENALNTHNWHTGTKSWASYQASFVESEKLKGKERLIPAGSTCPAPDQPGGATTAFSFFFFFFFLFASKQKITWPKTRCWINLQQLDWWLPPSWLSSRNDSFIHFRRESHESLYYSHDFVWKVDSIYEQHIAAIKCRCSTSRYFRYDWVTNSRFQSLSRSSK